MHFSAGGGWVELDEYIVFEPEQGCFHHRMQFKIAGIYLDDLPVQNIDSQLDPGQ